MPDERAVPNAAPRRAEGVEDSNVERERLIAWCEEQIALQREKMREAQKIVTVYATEHVQGATLGPDPDEVAMRSEYANNFWQIAALLRTPVPSVTRAAAGDSGPVGEAATITSDHLRDLERAAAWLEDTQDMVLLPRSLREIKAVLSSAPPSSAPAVSEGAELTDEQIAAAWDATYASNITHVWNGEWEGLVPFERDRLLAFARALLSSGLSSAAGIPTEEGAHDGK